MIYVVLLMSCIVHNVVFVVGVCQIYYCLFLQRYTLRLLSELYNLDATGDQNAAFYLAQRLSNAIAFCVGFPFAVAWMTL